MKKIILLLITLLIYFAGDSFAFVRNKGALDFGKRNFYFTGYNLYLWSDRKTEFKDKYNFIFKYNFEQKIKEIFFTADCFFKDLTTSPQGNYLGVLCTQGEKSNSLIILNAKGEKVYEILDSIQEYAWSIDDTDLIYVTGSVGRSGDKAVINPTGVWIYNLKGKNKQKIADKGWYIRRMTSDNHVYFWDGKKTVKYDANSQSIKETNIKEKADYSPDGRFYAYYPISAEDPAAWEEPYWSPFRIFDTKDDKDLSATKIGFISERNPGDIVWGKDSKKIVFRGNVSRIIGEQMIYVYDLDANLLVKQFKGKIVGFDEGRAVLVIYRDSGFYLENMP